jgi:[calcium/calmodulin-dependent protein kinase] kinase
VLPLEAVPASAPEPEPELKVESDGEESGVVGGYTIGRKLGAGAYAEVFLGTTVDGAEYAVKVYRKGRMRKKRMGWGKPTMLQMVAEEIAIMKKLKHPNLVHLHEVIDDDESDQLLVIMELLVNGTTSVAEAGVPFHSEDTARRFLVGATLGLEALHARGVLHRDVKPENVLIGNDGQTKLADLGVAQSLSPPVDEDGDGVIDAAEIAHAARCKAWTGTPAFLAPEVASGADEFDGMAVDMWALGVTLYNWLSGGLPYWSDEGSELALYEKIATEPWELPANPKLGEPVAELLRRLLEKRPAARITMAGLRRHRFLTLGGAEPLPPHDRSAFDPVTEVELAAAVSPTGRRRSPPPAGEPVPAAVVRSGAGLAAAAELSEKRRQQVAKFDQDADGRCPPQFSAPGRPPVPTVRLTRLRSKPRVIAALSARASARAGSRARSSARCCTPPPANSASTSSATSRRPPWSWRGRGWTLMARAGWRAPSSATRTP